MNEEIEILEIIIAEPSFIIRSGLVFLLRQIKKFHIHPIEVESIKSLENILATRTINLLFVSPSFNQFDIELFQQKYPDLRCFAIVSDLSHICQCNSYSGLITVFDSLDKISKLITDTMKGKSNIYPNRNSLGTINNPDLLSNREKEILICIVKGLANKDIAEKLYLSIYTVMTHRQHICKKLEIHSVAGLTIYAIANNLIDVDELQ
jgi:two-component system, NarL family, response regulator NreC